MSRDEYRAMPARITVRELRVRVKDKTKRVRNLVIVTTLVDSNWRFVNSGYVQLSNDMLKG
jgi:hypothetical protein